MSTGQRVIGAWALTWALFMRFLLGFMIIIMIGLAVAPTPTSVFMVLIFLLGAFALLFISYCNTLIEQRFMRGGFWWLGCKLFSQAIGCLAGLCVWMLLFG